MGIGLTLRYNNDFFAIVLFTQEKPKTRAKILPLELLNNEVYSCYYKPRNSENQLKGWTSVKKLI
jgi:hypothetical protein